jgi:Na+-transporting methylmalonyl-CoA/oxaloacetate decarboxylase beta subunit
LKNFISKTVAQKLLEKGMLMFGNLVKEIGSNTSRLFDAASNSIMNAATIFLGISVGAPLGSKTKLYLPEGVLELATITG